MNEVETPLHPRAHIQCLNHTPKTTGAFVTYEFSADFEGCEIRWRFSRCECGVAFNVRRVRYVLTPVV